MSDTRSQYTDLERRQIRSHTNIITVDRPDSSQVVDLHVYFLPRSFWKDKQNLAYNDAMEEAISAGFIRVSNNLNLNALRNEIEVQCASDELFPKEYIYLRSVGRAMTRVKDKQEYELKVKNFRPPQTYAPEIFLLEGRHDEFNNVPATPISMHSPSTNTFLQSRTKLRNGKIDSRIDDIENDTYDDHLKKNQSMRPSKILFSNSSTEHVNTQSYDALSSNISLNTDNWKTSNTKEFIKLQEEQERLKRRQNELEKLRQEMERKKKIEEDEKIRKKQLEMQLLQKQRQAQIDALNRQKEDAAIKIQSSYRGYRDRKKVNEIKRQELLKQQQKNYRNQQNQKNKNDKNEQDPEYLRKKLEFVKSSRLELESVREDLIRRLKLIHNRITLRRKEARDLWKKKYFSEKKKTPPLEEKVQTVLHEIENLQKKLYLNIESDVKTAAQTGYIHETELGSARLTSLKLQQEIDMLKRQVEHAKLRLTTDIKLRNQAETESKALKTELNQTKINLHHIKNKLITSYNTNNEMVEQLTAREY